MGREEKRGAVHKPASTGMAAAAATAQSQWQCTVAGLQHNLQQFTCNLAQMQSRVCRELAQAQTKCVGAPAALPVASLSHAAVAPGATTSWGGGDSYSSMPSSTTGSSVRGNSGSGAVSKEEVGRATWTFLHTLAAQYPESPTRQQQRDARNLIDILTRMYPCGECARHFREVVRQSPPAVASRHDFSLWMCEAHNVVNRRLGKPTFNCALVEARWAGMECGPEEGGDGRDACSLEVGRRRR